MPPGCKGSPSSRKPYRLTAHGTILELSKADSRYARVIAHDEDNWNSIAWDQWRPL
jgi:hypothetical protein